MGLDMYLYRAPRVPGLRLDDYLAAEQALSRHGPDGLADPALLQAHPGVAALASHVQRATIHPDGAITYTPATRGAVAVADAARTFYTLWEQVAYWRKANAIHRWFVEHVHGGEDDGYWFAEVPEAACRALLERVEAALASWGRAPELLPTQVGFFFGSTDYDEHYAADLIDTRNQLTRVLDTTDFTRQLLIYHPWW
jgi:hypothetical protein